jgi:hypothetical protein
LLSDLEHIHFTFRSSFTFLPIFSLQAEEELSFAFSKCPKSSKKNKRYLVLQVESLLIGFFLKIDIIVSDSCGAVAWTISYQIFITKIFIVPVCGFDDFRSTGYAPILNNGRQLLTKI